MTRELNVARLFAAIGAIIVIASVAIPTGGVYVALLGLAFVLNAILLHAFTRSKRERR